MILKTAEGGPLAQLLLGRILFRFSFSKNGVLEGKTQ
jgi:hypothetical protein